MGNADCANGVCPPSGIAGGDAGGATANGGTTGWTTGVTGQGTTGSSFAPRNLPCDVQDIVDEHCVTCHSDPPMGTYMPLLTQAHFQAPSTTEPARKYYELTADRINNAEDPMPPRGVSTLSEAELATMNAWLEAGAPSSTENCGGGEFPVTDAGVEQDASLEPEELECHRFLAHAPGDKNAKFQVGVQRDSYFNMTFAAPWDETVYAVIIRPIIDNGPVLHHWLIYRDMVPGIDGAVIGSNGAHTAGELVHGWAPGGSALDFSDRGDVAFEMPGGTYTMEFHYNSSDASAQDASGAEVCFKRRKPKNVASMSWVGLDHGLDGYIQGGVYGTQSSGNCLFPSDKWVGTCDPWAFSSEPIHLMVVWPHMHEAGVRMSAVIEGPNGTRPLHNEAFDFDYQRSYEVEEVLMPGEKIVTTCEYSKPSCSGQATTAEMCYLYTYAWPKGALTDNGGWGTFAHGDNVCLGQ